MLNLSPEVIKIYKTIFIIVLCVILLFGIILSLATSSQKTVKNNNLIEYNIIDTLYIDNDMFNQPISYDLLVEKDSFLYFIKISDMNKIYCNYRINKK